jgi:succinate dehydrogenase / fumarate reductase membrane anchor subunit
MSAVRENSKTPVGAHYGTSDWLVQRASSVVVTAHIFVAFARFVLSAGAPMAALHDVFSPEWMRISTAVALIAITWHAWVGVRDILMDYVKPTGVRVFLQLACVVWLFACLAWGLRVLLKG